MLLAQVQSTEWFHASHIKLAGSASIFHMHVSPSTFTCQTGITSCKIAHLEVVGIVGQLVHWNEGAAWLLGREHHWDAGGNAVLCAQPVPHLPCQGVERCFTHICDPDPGGVCLCSCTKNLSCLCGAGSDTVMASAV